VIKHIRPSFPSSLSPLLSVYFLSEYCDLGLVCVSEREDVACCSLSCSCWSELGRSSLSIRAPIIWLLAWRGRGIWSYEGMADVCVLAWTAH